MKDLNFPSKYLLNHMKREKSENNVLLDAKSRTEDKDKVSAKILIIDDDDDFLVYLKKYLQKSHDVVGLTYRNEFDALKAIQEEDLDMVFLDIGLENVIDGLE